MKMKPIRIRKFNPAEYKIKVIITREMMFRIKLGIMFFKLGARIMGTGIEIIDADQAEAVKALRAFGEATAKAGEALKVER